MVAYWFLCPSVGRELLARAGDAGRHAPARASALTSPLPTHAPPLCHKASLQPYSCTAKQLDSRHAWAHAARQSPCVHTAPARVPWQRSTATAPQQLQQRSDCAAQHALALQCSARVTARTKLERIPCPNGNHAMHGANLCVKRIPSNSLRVGWQVVALAA